MPGGISIRFDGINLLIAIVALVSFSGCLNQGEPPQQAVNSSGSLPPVSASPDQPKAGTAQPSADQIRINNFAFNPSTITVSPGTSITWTNHDSAPHTVTESSGKFGSQTLNQGQSFSYIFKEPGTFGYYCAIHPSMKAKVVVV